MTPKVVPEKELLALLRDITRGVTTGDCSHASIELKLISEFNWEITAIYERGRLMNESENVFIGADAEC